jgi:hypothetical protein
MNRTARTIAATVVLLSLASFSARAGESIAIRIEAGRSDRRDTPVRVQIAEDRLGPEVRAALDPGPLSLGMVDPSGAGKVVVVQAERASGEGAREVRLTWVEPGPIKAGESKSYRLDASQPLRDRGPWRILKSKGAEELRHVDRLVFRYNTAPRSSPDYGPIQHRDAYIHPALTPTGVLVTGDFSRFHPHHRGIFLAYAKAQVGGESLDFWNIHTNKGKIHHEGLDVGTAGPVTARISTRHLWQNKAGKPLLREQWDVEAYDVAGSPYWIFDLTSTQRAVDRPFEVQPYRYGGMAYRGPEPFVRGTLDVLTAEGRHRVDGNLQPTRWVDLTGPVADGSKSYAGVMIADHPGNIHHPTVARIHPTTLPFFSYVPASKESVLIDSKTPVVFRYRVLIHDGHPDASLDERVWRDFADPPRVKVEDGPVSGASKP